MHVQNRIAGPSLACLAFLTLTRAQQGPREDPSIPTFGTTVVISSGLRGDIYLIPAGTAWLPNFNHLKPLGTIYTTRLNIPRTSFQQGFPGVTSRYEWFAIDYTGNFWIEKMSAFRFGLTSDDGSKLYIDGHVIINNDGIHPSSGCSTTIQLAHGIHSIRVSYFQGPRFELSLILGISKPGEPWQIFDTRHFTPPSDSSHWTSNDDELAKNSDNKFHRRTCGSAAIR